MFSMQKESGFGSHGGGLEKRVATGGKNPEGFSYVTHKKVLKASTIICWNVN